MQQTDNEKLIAARVARCLSVNQASRMLGADRKTILRWEHGQSTPQPYFREKLCKLYGSSLDALGYDLATLLYAHVGDITASLPVVGDADLGTPITVPTDLLEIAAMILRMEQQQRGWTEKELEEYTMKKLQSKQGQISRREFNTLAVAVPLAAMSLSSAPEEMLPHVEASLITAWRMARGSDLAMSQAIVQAYLPVLAPLVEKESIHQAATAQLVAKSYLLSGMINMHLADLGARELDCQQAVKYAEVSGDVDLITASKRWLACTYFYMNQPARALAIYNQAGQDLAAVTPLLRSSVQVESAVVQAQTGQHQGALTAIGQAQETFFVDAANDPGALYTGHDLGVLTLWTGLTHYHLGDYQQALTTFEQIDGLTPRQAVSERIRLQFLNQQALTLLKLNELERAATYLEAAATGARELGSKVRYDEAQRVYHAMDFLYPGDARVRDLQPHFVESM